MQRHVLIALLAVLGLTLAVLPGGNVRAEGEEGVPEAVWTYDVRVVRVDLPVPERAEQPAWGESATIGMSWPEILAALKARGKTTLLLDQRITAVAGLAATARQKHTSQIQAFQNRDMANERWQGALIDFGCTAYLLSADVLEYDVEARWLLPPLAEEAPQPTQATASWKGTHPLLGGRTLVLWQSEQVELPAGHRMAVELHVFVTGRVASAD
ncbi:MAG: hypothetical protein ACYTG6_11110 [Planctomycetota bacterium]|jgi:hypothetical protein